MIKTKAVLLTFLVSVFFSFTALAADDAVVTDTKVETQSLELEAADVSLLRLSTVENEAAKNSNEIHQEASVGRAGLQSVCICKKDANGNIIWCQ